MTANQIKRLVAERIREKIAAEPEKFSKAIELGLFDPEWIADPDDRPFKEVVNLRRFQEALAERAKAEPSVLAELDLSGLEALGSRWALQPGEADTHDRSNLTVVFTDLEGFTTFTADAGDGAASRLLTSHYEVVTGVVKSRGGRVVKTIGDGHMLTCPEASAAVLASVELVAHEPEPLRLRAGAHVGEVMETRGDVLGHVVNVAARVTDAAGGGTSLVTTQVRDAAGTLPSVSFGEPHPETLKGLPDPVAVCDVAAAA